MTNEKLRNNYICEMTWEANNLSEHLKRHSAKFKFCSAKLPLSLCGLDNFTSVALIQQADASLGLI